MLLQEAEGRVAAAQTAALAAQEQAVQVRHVPLCLPTVARVGCCCICWGSFAAFLLQYALKAPTNTSSLSPIRPFVISA